MKIFRLLILLLLPLLSFSQQGFPGYTQLKAYTADFNADKQPDKIVVYERPYTEADSLGVENAMCRRVAIYFGSKSGYTLHNYNDKIVECSACGGGGVGDPFQDIKIKGNYFSVESLYGACDKTFLVVTFKYDSKAKEFYLHKKGSENYNCNEFDAKGAVIINTFVETTKDFGLVRFTDYR